MKMLISKIIMLLKDPNPCKECLVVPICKETCSPKHKWESKTNSFFLPFQIILGFVLVVVFSCLYAVFVVLFYFGLIDETTLKRVSPIPHEWDEDDNFY